MKVKGLASLQKRLDFILQPMQSTQRFLQVRDLSRFGFLTNCLAALHRLDLGIGKSEAGATGPKW